MRWFSKPTRSPRRDFGSSTDATMRRRSSFEEKRFVSMWSPAGKRSADVSAFARIVLGFLLPRFGHSIAPWETDPRGPSLDERRGERPDARPASSTRRAGLAFDCGATGAARRRAPPRGASDVAHAGGHCNAHRRRVRRSLNAPRARSGAEATGGAPCVDGRHPRLPPAATREEGPRDARSREARHGLIAGSALRGDVAPTPQVSGM